MKRILIDARMFGTKHTGIGRYVQNLLNQVATLNQNYDITLLINDPTIKNIYLEKFKYLETNIKHYTFSEQITLPWILYLHNFDLVHFTHFNKPVLYIKTSVITVHDLIKNFYYGKDSTTRFSLLYWFKYLFYRLFTTINITHNHIIVPSNYWRDYIIDTYKINPDKIITTHESFDPRLINLNPNLKPGKYLLYVGNLYPHKNLQVVFKALQSLPNITLKIISKPSIFQDRAKKMVESMGLSGQVEFLGYVEDSKFKTIFSKALALVHPSLMEGFSLPGLEAMALSCPVISSNSTCLPEIHGASALYFDPLSSADLITQIKIVQDPEVRLDLIKRGHQHIRIFSWQTLAQKTLAFYDQIFS